MVATDGWIRVSSSHPCPICGKPDWCLVTSDGNVAICPRVEQGSMKDIGAAGYLHVLNDRRTYSPHPLPSLPPLPKTPAKRSTADLTCELERYQPYAERGCNLLQEQLGLDSAVLQRLEVGYCPLQKTWFFPERDADNHVIGIQRRLHNHSKRRLKGSSAGLTYASNWDTGSGPLLLVEGASDVAAGMMLGISVIGRPSNRGGCALLGTMLQPFPDDREIIVLGERDQKENGLWPGKEGAIHTATDLAKRLLRPVQWALPPDNAKDLRAWVNEYATQTPAQMGALFLQGLQLHKIQPPPIQRAPLAATGNILAADEYRHLMLKIRKRSLDQPGIYLDRSGTGHGKSSIDFEMICPDLLGEACR
ncbi:toprim domain-containing protein [Thalassoglobus sp.]|uniref:toprim domain-containing protein n=1 Tax=Thalassoglobus sp. TaxID=2795869 RepID=UPI003AA7D25E